MMCAPVPTPVTCMAGFQKRHVAEHRHVPNDHAHTGRHAISGYSVLLLRLLTLLMLQEREEPPQPDRLAWVNGFVFRSWPGPAEWL